MSCATAASAPGVCRIGYQSCDDSTAQAGIFDEGKCTANAKLTRRTTGGDGVGPFTRAAPTGQIPIANRAGLAMISPTNSDIGLTHATPLTPEGLVASLYPTGKRNYVRIFPREDAQAAAAALFARDAGAHRVAVLQRRWIRARGRLPTSRAPRADSGSMCCRRADGTRKPAATTGSRTRLRGPIPMLSTWPDCSTGTAARVIRNLRAKLPSSGSSSPTMASCRSPRSSRAPDPRRTASHVTRSGPVPQIGFHPEGRQFVAQFAATQGTRPVYFESVYAAQAAELLLDAIARADGSRESVVAALRRTRVKRGLLGGIAFDSEGDITRAPGDRLSRAARRRLRAGLEHGGRADPAYHQRPFRAPPLGEKAARARAAWRTRWSCSATVVARRAASA